MAELPPGIEIEFDAEHRDPRAILNRALRMPEGQGVVLRFLDRGAAYRYKMALYNHRTHFRHRRARKLPRRDPAWGTTPWDGLELRQSDNLLWVGHRLTPTVGPVLQGEVETMTRDEWDRVTTKE